MSKQDSLPPPKPNAQDDSTDTANELKNDIAEIKANLLGCMRTKRELFRADFGAFIGRKPVNFLRSGEFFSIAFFS